MKILKLYVLTAALCLAVHSVMAQPAERNLMAAFGQEQVRNVLIDKEKWRPFPKLAAEWKQYIPDSTIQFLIREADQYSDVPFAALPASLLLQYQKTGNRSAYEEISFQKRERLFALILAESLEGKGRFMEAVTDGIWSTCEETYWGIPAHLNLQKAGIGLPDVEQPSVDIFAAEAATILALADYLLGEKLDSISPLIRKRIYYEANRRILAPMEKEGAQYWYLQKGTREMPVNNWNPWVVSCWMSTLLLLENNTERRARELYYAMQCLDHYINWLGEDGAIDEGPSYWPGAIGRLFDALNILESASGGKISVYDKPIIRMAQSYIYKVHISGNYFINTADASPVINQDGLLLYRIGKAVQDPVMARFGSWAYLNLNKKEIPKDFSKTRRLWNLLVVNACAADSANVPALRDVWLESIQLMAARSVKGLFVASHGGHNAESHNHNDVGDFVVYAAGRPVIIDAGAGTYTAKTFSKQRYDLWYNNSGYHNLPVINGFTQQAGANYAAKQVSHQQSDRFTRLRMDISAAYPTDAGVLKWSRLVQLDKCENTLLVKDVYMLKKWLSQVSQTFMTVCDTDLSTPGKVVFKTQDGEDVYLKYDADIWDLKKERMSSNAPDEKRLADNWGNKPIWRLLLLNKTERRSGHFSYTISF